jgi:penicillin-binding protein 2
MGIVFVVMGALMIVYLTTLYKLQVYDAGAAAEADALQPSAVSTDKVVLPAQRGDILDRNGALLVSNRPSYNVTLTRDALLKTGDANGIIKELIYAAEENGVRYNDTLPVTRGAPFEYLADMSDKQRGRLDKFLSTHSLDGDITASELISWMKGQFGLDYTTGIADARLIIGVRYELDLRALPSFYVEPYVFAEDVDVGFISVVKERSYPGVSAETTSVREYHTTYAAHILGNTGKMNSSDYEKYSALGYPMDAVIGKAGAEAGFEQYLHGVDGARTASSTDNGAIVDVNTTKAPEPGSNVYLSIDIGLQGYTENELEKFIDTINLERPEESKVIAGAVVVTDVRTGEILSMASYPTFDLASLSENIDALNRDPTLPMWDRASHGTYNPGSTFKMVTALAGLREGTITRWSQINDTGQFTEYSDYRPYCWIYPQTGAGHGPLNVVEALRESCNYFFYQVGASTDKYAIAKAAEDFGLGVSTGIEIPEKIGTIATPEYKRRVLDEGWWNADTLLAAIGQGHNMFTPLQLAGYAATIANGGERRAMTILSRVKSADYSANILTQTPKTLNTIAEGDYIDILQEGMKAAAQSGTAASVFKDYKIKVAAKTGTVQRDTSEVNNGMFVCYAPADDPEIAISVAIEKGGSGAEIMEIARTVLDYYYRDQTVFELRPEGALIP